MIIDKSLEASTSQPVAGSSTASLPPSFDQHEAMELVNNDASPPPPGFSEYDADWFRSNGTIISHDKHLNEDGEALYRFIIPHARRPPKAWVKLAGSHSETRTRLVSTRDERGNLQHTTETYTETVRDFDFKVDLTQNLDSKFTFWTLPDTEPALRGRGYLEVDRGLGGGGRRRAQRAERNIHKRWSSERRERGLAPWIGIDGRMLNEEEVADLNPEASSKTIREWADEYCSSQRDLKDFTFRKIIYGWNFDELKSAIRSIVASTGYTGDFVVEIGLTEDKIHIRPNNLLAKILSVDGWQKLLLFIILVYPVVWLFAWIVSGRWDVCGVAYQLKSEAEPTPAYSKVADSNANTQEGGAAEWVRTWDTTMRNLIFRRAQQDHPVLVPMP